jgi:hypothetical protein
MEARKQSSKTAGQDKKATKDLVGLRKAVRLALPLLQIFRDGIVDAYSTKPGDVTSISKRERATIADLASLDKAIRQAEKVMMRPAIAGATQRAGSRAPGAKADKNRGMG